MAFFTSNQANASSIVRAESVTSNGTHTHWVFGIIDEDGNYCDWSDSTLSATASNSEQRTAIHDHLTTSCEKVPAPPTILHIDNDDIIDTVVGATGP